VPAGIEIAVRTEETIDSGRAAEGQSYAAEVTRDVPDANGDVVVPRGSNAQMVIRSASQGGRFRGTSDMVLDLTSVSVDGRQYQLSAGTVEDRGKAGLGKNERTAKFVGGGALLGTVIGAIAGHGKGAAIGRIGCRRGRCHAVGNAWGWDPCACRDHSDVPARSAASGCGSAIE
jgi:hypothetical protein